MHQYLETLDGKTDTVLRYAWNMAIVRYTKDIDDEVTPEIDAIYDEFEDEMQSFHGDTYHDPVYVRMLQAISFIAEHIAKNYLSELSKLVDLEELMFHQYDDESAILILDQIRSFNK